MVQRIVVSVGCWVASVAVLFAVGVNGRAEASRSAAAAAASPWKDRVFTLYANLSKDNSLDPDGWNSMAVAPDHTVYWYTSGGELFALRPDALQPRRLEPSALQGGFVDSLGIAADGAPIVSSFNQLGRLAPDGTLSWIAGTGEQGLRGDGGLATAAQLCLPGSIVARPDGGIVFADAGGAVVRAIDPQGYISTLLTAEPRTPPADCLNEPRTEWIKPLAARANGDIVARIERPTDPNELPADVVTIDRHGRRRTLAKDFFARAVNEDDTMLAIDGGDLRRRAPGTKDRVLMKEDPDYFEALFDHDGIPARRYGFSLLEDAIFAPDGGIIVDVWADERDRARLLYLPPARPGRTAVALFPYRGRASARAYRARFLTTTRATAALTVFRGSRRLAARTASLGPGWHTLIARGHLPATTATARLTLAGPNGQRASDTLRVVTGGRLPRQLAHNALRLDLCDNLGNNCLKPRRSDVCQRYSEARVDCRFRLPWGCRAGTALLTRQGLVRVRRYARCPRSGPPLSDHPRYSPDYRWRTIGPPQQH